MSRGTINFRQLCSGDWLEARNLRVPDLGKSCSWGPSKKPSNTVEISLHSLSLWMPRMTRLKTSIRISDLWICRVIRTDFSSQCKRLSNCFQKVRSMQLQATKASTNDGRFYKRGCQVKTLYPSRRVGATDLDRHDLPLRGWPSLRPLVCEPPQNRLSHAALFSKRRHHAPKR